MSLGLATDGVYSGTATATDDTGPPMIAIISPTSGVAPGSPGGFAADFPTASTTPIVVQITDDTGIDVALITELGSPDEVVVFRESNFRGRFTIGSTQVPIIGGAELQVKETGGWAAATDPTMQRVITLTFAVVDTVGNAVLETHSWTLPAKNTSPPQPGGATDTDELELATDAINLLPSQFRSFDP